MAYLELQTRSIEEFSKPDYEVKGGIGYNIDKNNQPFNRLRKIWNIQRF
jgi:hypothetical protein